MVSLWFQFCAARVVKRGNFSNIAPEIDVNETTGVVSTKKLMMPYYKLLTNFTCLGPHREILALSRFCTELDALCPYFHELWPIFPNTALTFILVRGY